MTTPSLFISHGAPLFALQPGTAGPLLAATGHVLGRPRGIVVVSPHWITRGVAVTAAAHPETIHDFGGFDPALYDITYPAPGDPALAARIVDLLRTAGWDAAADPQRGLDHGAWVPLLHLLPQADIPALQVSMPHTLTAAKAYDLGRALAPLADEGVLIVGSGSLTHNLYEFRMGDTREADYAREFTQWIRAAVQAGDHAKVVSALEQAPHAKRAHPTPDHFLPLPVALGAAASVLPVTVLDGGIEHGVLSMESYVFGRDIAGEVQNRVHANARTRLPAPAA